MSKTSRALQRLGVGLLSAATISGGLVAFVAPSASAVVTGPVTTVKITPVNAALSTQSQDYNNDDHAWGDSNIGCQLFTLQALNASGDEVPSASLNIILTPSAGVDSEVCDGPRNTSHSSTGSFSFLNPTGADNINGQGAGNPGQPDQATGTATGPITIGINEYTGDSYTGFSPHGTPTAVAGTIGITAYVDSNSDAQVSSGEPKATANLDIVSSPSAVNQAGQDEIVDALTVDQTAVNRINGNYYTPFMITAKHGSDLVAGTDVLWQMKNAAGTIIDNDTCGATNNSDAADLGASDGMAECDVSTPDSTTSDGAGPYTVTFFVPKASCDAGSSFFVTGCEISTTATITTYAKATAGSIVKLTCGTATTAHYAPYYCWEPSSATSETFTAKVLGLATPSATTPTVPEPNVVVWFNQETYGGTAGGYGTTTPANCVTGTDGTCTVTEHRAAGDVGGPGSYYELYATTRSVSGFINSSDYNADGDVLNSTHSYGEVDFGYGGFESPATNIFAGNATDTAQVGQSKLVTFNIRNQYDNPSTETCFTDYDAGSAIGVDDCDSLATDEGTNGGGLSSGAIPVTLTVTGGGTFTDGTTTKVVTAANGQAQATITSSTAGANTVTASLDPAATDCSVPSAAAVGALDSDDENYNDTWELDPTARAGNCTASEALTFTGPDTLSVSAGGGQVGHVENAKATVKKSDGSPDTGVVVHFTVTGANSASGSAVTNASGVASFAYTPRHAGSDTVAAYADATGTPHDSQTVSIAKAAEHPTITLSSKHGKVRVNVTSHPSVPGASVTYQVKRNGRWHTIGSGTIGSNGKTHKSFSEPVGKHRTFRAHVGGTSDVNAGTSKAKHIKVKE